MALRLGLLLFLFTLCGTGDHLAEKVKMRNPPAPGYNLSAPDKIYLLPMILYEISGLTAIDASTVACVQDEYGIVFFFDLNEGSIGRTLVFGAEGDYEDLARAGGTMYVMRSDELLVEIQNFVSEHFKAEAYEARIPGSNIESLCFDRSKERLLMMPREASHNDKLDKDERFVYAFNIKTGEVKEEPVLSLDIKQIEKFAVDYNVDVPMKGKKGKKKPDISLKPSAMAINPVTGRLFILDSPERLLFIFDMNGNIEWLEKLDKDLFPQPEGITFMSNGDMLISNEGRGKEATLLRFNYN